MTIPCGRSRVPAFERARGGNLFVEWHKEDPQTGERKRRQRSIGHQDREDAAGLEHVDGLGWHALRRKFADDLRDLPLKNLAAARGWKRTETVVECYQSPDQERIREALEAR